MSAKSIQSCPTLCNPVDYSPTGILCSWASPGSGFFDAPWDLPNPGIEPTSLTASASVGEFVTTSATWEAPFIPCSVLNAVLALTMFSCYPYELVLLLIQFPHLEMKKLRPGEGM